MTHPSNKEGKGLPKVIGVPLGKVIPRKFVTKEELVLLHDRHSVAAERYRRLVSRLEQLTSHIGKSDSRVITVTSAAPDEGKSTTTLNLSLALAESRDHSVALIDGDLRRPTIGGYLTPKPTHGLSEVLAREVPLDHALVIAGDPKLTILPSGGADANPLGGLRSEYFLDMMDEMRRRFDWIIVDTPPAVPFTDATVINERSDGALLVVRAGQTPKPMIEKALESLAGGVVLGVVLNDLKATPVDRYYYRYDEYNPYRYGESKSARKGGKKK